MAVLDARTLDDNRTETHCDVCIVGAGAAGIYLGVRLAQRGLAVIILEAGGHVGADGAAVGIESTFEGTPYRGATEGRAFGLGGTTSRWGGVLIPHSERDFRPAREGQFDPWRHIVAVVKQRSPDVLRTLGLDPQRDSPTMARRFLGDAVATLHSSGLEIRVAEFLPFRRKNLAFLLRESSPKKGSLTVFLHAVATNWPITVGPDGVSRLTAVMARCGDKTVTVTAHSFVLAAGALESARLLLEMERQTGANPFRQGAAVGCYLGDHLSCTIANLRPEDWALTAQRFGPRFKAGRMQSFRFLERSAPDDSPRCFAHFIFENENPGFLLAKKLLTGLQARVLPNISLAEFRDGATGLLALGWHRMMGSRLYITPKTPVHLQLDIEQRPHYSNRIRLDDRVDAWGRPMPVIQWDVHAEDYAAIRTTARRLLALWPGRDQRLPELCAVERDPAGQKPHDAYHPVGACRMGTDSEAVVDAELRVHGIPNLAVLSTAVFPSAGTANPTFSMLCLGEALAERLDREGRR